MDAKKFMYDEDVIDKRRQILAQPSQRNSRLSAACMFAASIHS
jgi:hypothetical protein